MEGWWDKNDRECMKLSKNKYIKLLKLNKRKNELGMYPLKLQGTAYDYIYMLELSKEGY